MRNKIATALLLVGLAVPAAEAADMTIAVQRVPDTLDPILENSNISQRIIFSIFDTLLKVDFRNGGVLVSDLAESWALINPRTVEFKLRQGVHFHNGAELNAADVVFSFSPQRIGQDNDALGDAGAAVSKPFLGGIESVEEIDTYTVRITMKQSDALILQRFANYPSQIMSKVEYDKAGSYAEFASHPVGTGPYAFKEFVAGDRVVIEKFEDHFAADKAAADLVTFTVVPEIVTRIAGLRSGQFDMITEVSPDHINEINDAPDTSIIGGPVLNIRGLIFDSTNETLDDPRIRQALNLAIDRVTLTKALYGDNTSVPNGWQMDVFGDMYLADRPIPEFNVEKAKALLAEAGYNGEEIEYRTQNAYYTNQIETAQILVSMWKKAGLNVKLAVKENWGQVNEDNETRHIFDGSFSAYYPDPMGQFWRRFGPSGGWASNKFYIVDPEMIALGDTLATETDTAKRRVIFAEMLDRFAVDPNGSALHKLTQIYGVRSGVSYIPLPNETLDLTTSSLTLAK